MDYWAEAEFLINHNHSHSLGLWGQGPFGELIPGFLFHLAGGCPFLGWSCSMCVFPVRRGQPRSPPGSSCINKKRHFNSMHSIWRWLVWINQSVTGCSCAWNCPHHRLMPQGPRGLKWSTSKLQLDWISNGGHNFIHLFLCFQNIFCTLMQGWNMGGGGVGVSAAWVEIAVYWQCRHLRQSEKETTSPALAE